MLNFLELNCLELELNTTYYKNVLHMLKVFRMINMLMAEQMNKLIVQDDFVLQAENKTGQTLLMEFSSCKY
jgi:hypothetical protein